MIRLLRVTRHPISDEMKAHLTNVLGDTLEVTEYNGTVDKKALRELAEQEFDLVEVVLPTHMLAFALELWPGKVIRSTHRRQAVGTRTKYTFNEYHRVLKVVIETVPLRPA